MLRVLVFEYTKTKLEPEWMRSYRARRLPSSPTSPRLSWFLARYGGRRACYHHQRIRRRPCNALSPH
jgi:hypothetical protein